MRLCALFLRLCLLVMLNSLVYGRGPHHPHGQTPVDQGHHHYQPQGTGSMTGDSQLLHDAKHLEEDAIVLTPEMLAQMTPEELEFQYFAAHDFDGNSKLDGLELLKAVYHTVEHSPHVDDDNTIEPEAKPFDSYVALVDRTLAQDDSDGDGFISYPEYRAARSDRPDRTLSVLAPEE